MLSCNIFSKLNFEHCVLILGVFILTASISLFIGNVRAGRRTHSWILRNIVASPMSFFDTTPGGRILNRFSKDIDVIDTLIAINFQAWVTCLLRVLSVPIVIGISTPLFLAVFVPIVILYYVVQVSWYSHISCHYSFNGGFSSFYWKKTSEHLPHLKS